MKTSKISKGIDVLGNIAILKFPEKISLNQKKKTAEKVLKNNRSIKTILEKTGRFKGRLRKQKTNYLTGEKTKEALYRENNCTFRFNVDNSYFSPRLSNERKEISEKIKENSEVLVMFSGVNPFGIVIAKNSKARKIYSVEINKEANKYAKLNAELNRVKDKIETTQGNVKIIAKKFAKKKMKFDFIIMPRPRLKESFLKEAFSLSKKGTNIFYYDFCKDDEINLILEKIKHEAKLSKKKIKILQVKKAGEIAPYKFRMRIDFKII